MTRERIIWTQSRLVERVTDLEGRTLMFQFRHDNGTSYHPVAGRIEVENMPAFEGKATWAEVQKVSGKPWAFFRATRLIDPPAG